jgi:hypothetical protein
MDTPPQLSPWPLAKATMLRVKDGLLLKKATL